MTKYCRYCPHAYEEDDNVFVVIDHNLKHHEDIFLKNLLWGEKKK